MAGIFFLVGSAGSIPSSIILARDHESPQILLALTVLGIVSGLACFLVPWERARPSWHFSVGALAIFEVFLVTQASAQHYAVLYVLIVALGAFVYRPGWVVAGLTAASLIALLLGSLSAQHDQAHALAVSLIIALAMIALSLTIYRAREDAQVERMRAVNMCADVLRVTLALEAGHSRVVLNEAEQHRTAEVVELLQTLDALRSALRESLFRVDAAPVLVEAGSRAPWVAPPRERAEAA